MMGAVKGLSTGAAGVVDLGSWAVTTRRQRRSSSRSASAIGTDVTLAAPIKLADHVSKGWDDIGEMSFGKKKWSEGEAAAGHERRPRSATSAAGSSGA